MCCKTNIDGECGQEISEILYQDLDWNFILRRARKQDISPFLHYHISKIRPDIVENHFSAAKDDYYNITSCNLLLNQEFFKILDYFNERGIQIIPLKGIALIQQIYPYIGLRHIGDIDLLIRLEDLSVAEGLLRELGYMGFQSDNVRKDRYSPYLNTLVYKKTGDPSVMIHLHWHWVNTTLPLLPIYRIDINEIWDDARIEPCGGEDMLMMSPHHFLLYLSMHALHHSFERLILINDIQESIRFYGNSIDWDKLIDTAMRYNLSRPLYYSLYLCSEILGIPLPKGMLNRLKPHKFYFGEKSFVSNILNNKNRFQNLSYTVYLAIAGSLYNKVKFIWLTLFPPWHYISQIYQIAPGEVNIMHYNMRLVQGLRQALKLLPI